MNACWLVESIDQLLGYSSQLGSQSRNLTTHTLTFILTCSPVVDLNCSCAYSHIINSELL